MRSTPASTCGSAPPASEAGTGRDRITGQVTDPVVNTADPVTRPGIRPGGTALTASDALRRLLLGQVEQPVLAGVDQRVASRPLTAVQHEDDPAVVPRLLFPPSGVG